MSGYRLGFVVEDSIGHGTYRRLLERWVGRDPEVQATWMRVPYEAPDRWGRLPVVRSNWSLRASLRARERVRLHGDLQGLLYHTQLTALLGLRRMRTVPAVLSLDATPFNMDAVGVGYDHRPAGAGPLDRLKFHWNRALFRRAAALVPWSRWAAESLVRDYGADPARVRTIPPGVDLELWRPRLASPAPDGPAPLRLLFVGGDFERKGGPLLLDVLADLPAPWRLDVVTRSALAPSERVAVHRGLAAEGQELRRLFAAADALVLPTRGDCMPIVVLEAMAAGLPVVASRLGAIPEQVEDGVTGLLVPPGDGAALRGALAALAADPARRVGMGAAGRARAERSFDAARNVAALLEVLKDAVDRGRP